MNMFDLGSEKSGTAGIRPVSLLLMTTFTVCAFALMWAAVSCLDRISTSYTAASDGLAAAQFTANKLRSAEGSTAVYSGEDGTLDRIVFSRSDGYENVISFSDGYLSEALIPEGSNISRGEGIFEITGITVEGSGDAAKITVTCKGNKRCTVFAACGAETEFLTSGDT